MFFFTITLILCDFLKLYPWKIFSLLYWITFIEIFFHFFDHRKKTVYKATFMIYSNNFNLIFSIEFIYSIESYKMLYKILNQKYI